MPQRSSLGWTVDSARWWEDLALRERVTSATEVPRSKSFCSWGGSVVWLGFWVAKKVKTDHSYAVGVDGALGGSANDLHD